MSDENNHDEWFDVDRVTNQLKLKPAIVRR
jgi:hypothetical protein